MSAAAPPDEMPADVRSVARPASRVTARERRTITAGVAIVAIALSLTYVVVPFAARWSAREALLSAKVERLARLRAVTRDAPALQRAARAREAALAARPQQVIAARTASLAASALQSLVQDYAARSHVQVSRIDVASVSDTSALANVPDGAAGLPAIPATISAVADVYGLADFLSLLERGPRLVEITDLAAQSTRGPRGEPLLQLTITLRAPYAPTETTP